MSGLAGYNKLKVVSGIGEHFKDFRCGSICKEIIRIEEQLNKDEM